MTIKAVYASQTLSIYVTGSDLDYLLTGKLVLVPLFFEKELKSYHGARLELTVDGLALLNYVVAAEREEIEKGRMKGGSS